VEGLLGFITKTSRANHNYDTTFKKGISLKNSPSYGGDSAKQSSSTNQNDILSRWEAVSKAAVWLCHACSRNPARKCKSDRRIFAGRQSHQPFRSIPYFISDSTENRLADDGRIFSVVSRGFSFAGGRCVPGRSRSCESQNHPDCSWKAARWTCRWAFSRRRDS